MAPINIVMGRGGFLRTNFSVVRKSSIQIDYQKLHSTSHAIAE